MIVGVGASAGGLDALTSFVASIPEDSGLAYVVVQHLSPDHPSIMDQLLAPHACIPVRKIADRDVIAPDTIWVLPPGPFLEIEDGRFRLVAHDREEGLRTPIDRFFFSLADACDSNAFGVILSGTGSDGTKGIRAIKARGGIAIVQDSASAQFTGMPESAAATGIVDFSLRAEAIPARVVAIAKHARALETKAALTRLTTQVGQALPRVLETFDEANQLSFSGYKPGTLVRRIVRRLTLQRTHDVEDYILRLSDDPDERRQLVSDFLIGVTEFFRDPDSFTALRPLVREKFCQVGRDRLRVWVPGCSTGEEVYSLAILILEELDSAGLNPRLQVFGTDIDIESLRFAREGVYGATSLASMPEESRSRFFTRENGGFKVSPKLRETCVFAPHNLLQDPPFSRLDMISCRNVLIYLTTNAQEGLFPRFHYALNPGGILTLGPAETTGNGERYFKRVSRPHRIFLRDDGARAGFSAMHARVPSVLMPQRASAPIIGRQPVSASEPPDAIRAAAEKQFLATLAPPFAVIDGKDAIIHLSEAMTRFVRPQSGQPSLSMEALFQKQLRLPAISAVGEARQSKTRVAVRNVVVGDDAGGGLFDVIAEPLERHENCTLLTMQPVRQDNAATRSANPSESTLEAAERDLNLTRRRLTTLQEEYDTTEQQLRTANEEMLTMNEELQSSNEELETSHEELQSVNEELETINAELMENNRQLMRSNSDMKNLLESTGLPTLFLDSGLCVRLFTPELRLLLSIEDRDLGRPVLDLAFKIDYPDLSEDAAEVQAHLTPVEREVVNPKTEQTFSVRVRPYRSEDNRLDGCVITFVDVTQRRRNERKLEENAKALEAQLAELETLYQTAPIGLSLHDRDHRYLRINHALAEINGLPPEAHIGLRFDELIPDLTEDVEALLTQVLESGEPAYGVTIRGKTPAEPDRLREWIADYYPIRAGGEVVAVGACVREVTVERELEKEIRLNRERLLESEARLARLFDQAPTAIMILEGPDHRYIYANAAHDAAVGGRRVLGKPLREALPELADSEIAARMDTVFRTAAPITTEELEAVLDFGGDLGLQTRVYRQVLQPWFDANGGVGGVMTFNYDITREVELRRAVEEERGRLQRVQDSLAAFVGLTTPDGILLEANRTALERGGLRREDVIGKPIWETQFWAWDADAQKRLRKAIELAAKGETVSYEETVALAEDERIQVAFSLTPIRDETGAITELVPSGIDVTEQRKAEIALIDAVRRANSANEAKSRFLAVMSHEIRTPLNGVMGMAEVLDHRLEDEDHRQMLAIIRQSGETLLHLLNDILDYSKIEAGALEIEDTPFHVAELFDRVEATFRSRAEQKGLSFSVSVDDREAVRRGDSHRLAQILNNTVSNAVKFTEDGTVSVEASLGEDDRLTVVVRDTGLGMTEEQIARIFDEFGQADSSMTRQYGGSGLGMAITRRLVDMFSGAIDIESQPGHGTTIRIAIPLRPAGAEMRADLRQPVAQSLAGLRTLAVDDNAVNRDIVAAMLTGLGAEVEVVGSAMAFLETFKTASWDVLVIDILMPGIDGIAVIEAVRAIEAQSGVKRTPAVACTASVMPDQVRLYHSIGFDGVVAKPVFARSLAEEIGRVVL